MFIRASVNKCLFCHGWGYVWRSDSILNDIVVRQQCRCKKGYELVTSTEIKKETTLEEEE